MNTTNWGIHAATRRKREPVPGLLKHIRADMEDSIARSRAGLGVFTTLITDDFDSLKAVKGLLNTGPDFNAVLALLNEFPGAPEDQDTVSTPFTRSGTDGAIGVISADILGPTEATKDEISPLKERYAPATSPNVDLSFISVAHPLGPKDPENAVPTASDDSFQAISTAIRKSIAGKTSMHYQSRLSAESTRDLVPYRPPRKSTLNPEWARKSASHDILGITSVDAALISENGTGEYKNSAVLPHPGLPKKPTETIATTLKQTRSSEKFSTSFEVREKSFSRIHNAVKQELGQEPDLSPPVPKTAEIIHKEDKNGSKTLSIPVLNSLNDTSSRVALPARKRSSVFVSLPAREPLIIPTSPTRQSFKVRKSSKLQEKLGVAALYDTSHTKAGFSGNDDKYPRHSIKEVPFAPNGDNTLRRHTTVEKKTSKQDLARSFPNLKASTPAPETVVKSVNLAHTLARSLRNTTSSQLPRLATELRARSRSLSPEKSPTRGAGTVRNILARTPKMPSSYSTWTTNSGSPRREEKKPSKEVPASKSAVFPSNQKSRSPTRFGRSENGLLSASPADYKEAGVKQTVLNIESDLINRLTFPTNSSAQKVVHSPLKPEPKKVEKTEKMDSGLTRNRFMTTTLDPNNPPVFHTEAPVEGKKVEEREKKLPSVRKKTLMAQRNEAAAERPKQKIYINLNRTTNTHLPPRMESPKEEVTVRQREEVAVKQKEENAAKTKDETAAKAERKAKRILEEPVSATTASLAPSKSRRAAHGNAVPLPDAARGKFVEKRRKVETPNRKREKFLILPNTPFSLTAENLPDIPSESEDFNEHRRSWATTPELRRQMDDTKNVDSASAFGAVPKLNLEEVFGTVVLRLRGRHSHEIERKE